MTLPPADPLVGATIAQYEILAKIGGGGMGVVYAARDTRLGRRVALKFLPPQWSHDEAAKQRFVREAQAASATDHPNICTIHDIGTAPDGRLFLVMAYYEGETLKQKLEAGALDVEVAVEIAAQVAEGLAKAHAGGVVHRDIKPGNLMVCGEGVKILDFGLAKFATALQLTMEGSTLGTAAYMSPEQVKGEEADARSDVWSLGVVLYEMLAGRVPFGGGYAEAVSYAIRHETPTPLRTIRPEVPEALEQIVFRALHKDPAVRYQTARDFARALRMLQGRTLAQELLTVPLRLEPLAPAPPPPRRGRRRWMAAAALLGLLMVGTPVWVFSTAERIPIAIVPVTNQTGDTELDAYRMALTHQLSAALAPSSTVRVLPYERLLQMVRRFRAGGGDVSSREAVRAITDHSDAAVLVEPTLLYEEGAWRARLEFRDPQTATSRGTYETPAVVASLAKETVHGFVPLLARAVEDHVAGAGPARVYAAHAVRSLVAVERPAASRVRSLDVAQVFEHAMDAYDQQEYAAAFDAVTEAAAQDAQNPLLHAWRSRMATVLRRDEAAAEAAQRASALVSDEMADVDRWFVEAVAAEGRRDFSTAEARLRDLRDLQPDEVRWVIELAEFHDRRGQTQEATDTYVAALRLDEHLVRPHLELCRLYGPNRLNEAARSRQHGELALKGYEALGDGKGQALARLCLADVLRTAGPAERKEAQRHVEAALQALEGATPTYQLARAHYYAALMAGVQGRFRDSVALGERALAVARSSGNAVIEPLILMNLGVAHGLLRNRPVSVAYYRDSSKLFEALGEDQRAAQIQANAGAVAIEYGDLEGGLRDVQNALAVFQKVGNRQFEVFCLQAIGGYLRFTGRPAEAEREFQRAIAIARERDLGENLAALQVDVAWTRFERGDYDGARMMLVEALGDGSGANAARVRIRLSQTYTRLGDFAAAEQELTQAAADLQRRANTGWLPLLRTARGELALATGRLDEARTHFAASAAEWTKDQPDSSILDARAALGLLDVETGRVQAGRALLQQSLEQARGMGRYAMEVRYRVLLSRAALAAGDNGGALAVLEGLPAGGDGRTIDPELRAQIHFWRGEALARRGDGAGASAEKARARKVIVDLGQALPERYRDSFVMRPDIRRLAGDGVRSEPGVRFP